MKKVSLHTLGCKLNFAETSTIGRQFTERGYEVVEAGSPVDVFVLNTCSVTERADRECRQIIRRTLRQSPDAYVVVTGCYAQLQPEEIASIGGVDLVLGAREKFEVFRYAGDFAKRPVPQTLVSCIDDVADFDEAFSAEVGGRTRAFLKIQDGCDYHCSFCTIPLARGASRSVAPESALSQARYLANQGFREIVLTGVNVGDYGQKVGSNLFALMKELDRVDGIERIRISSIEPNLLTREMVELVLSSEKFCNHFHIPLQSGSDAILKRMRRRYATDMYRNLVENIKSLDADAGIGVDVIVGFPGETEELFEESYKFLADLPVTYLHAFTYSERENTPAATMAGTVPPAMRSRRNERLRMLSGKKRGLFHRSLSGRTLPVLFENADGVALGLTTNYVRVEASADPALTNTIQQVRILSSDDERCYGELNNSGEESLGHCAQFTTQSFDVSPITEFQ